MKNLKRLGTFGFILLASIIFYSFLDHIDTKQEEEVTSELFELNGYVNSNMHDSRELKDLLIKRLNKDSSFELEKSTLAKMIGVKDIKVINNEDGEYLLAEWVNNRTNEKNGFLAEIVKNESPNGGVVLSLGLGCKSNGCLCPPICICQLPDGSCEWVKPF